METAMRTPLKSLAPFAASAALVAGAVVGMPAAASAAQAPSAAAPETKARIAMAPSFERKLERLGAKTSAIGAAKRVELRDWAAYWMPASTKKGERVITTTGGIRVSKGADKLPLTHFRINAINRGVKATISHSARAKFFHVRASDRPALGAYRITLNKLSAGQLNAVLDTQRFEAGQTYGYVKVKG
jgi:hypothetical protein